MHQRDLEHDNKYCKDIYPEPKHYYIVNAGFMVFGAVIYAMLHFALITIGKELFTMEDFIRGRERQTNLSFSPSSYNKQPLLYEH